MATAALAVFAKSPAAKTREPAAGGRGCVISMNKALFLYGGKSGGPGGVAAGLLKEEAKGRGDDEAESLQ
eukprot:6193096-Pleurochrysis_carterae.AAC.2